MKYLLPLTLVSTLLVGCGESGDNASQSSGSESSPCHSVLKQAVKSAVGDATDIANKGDAIGDTCSVAFKLDDIDYQADFDMVELGTANEMKTVGVMEMSRFEFLEKKISFYKEKEVISDVGDKAIYYKKGDNSELTTLAGDNVIQLSVLNWNTRTYDKALAIKVTKAILVQDYPAKTNQ